MSAAIEVDSYVTWQDEGRVSIHRNGQYVAVLTVAEAEALRDELSAALERLENWDQAADG